MDQQNMLIATGGILVSLGILAIGFNKLSPDTYGDDNPIFGNSMNRSTILGWDKAYPVNSYQSEPDDLHEQRTEKPVMSGGRTLCKRCHYKSFTRRK